MLACNPDPTTRAAWLVVGEEELGPQRRCAVCRHWWPLEAPFWLVYRRTVTRGRGRGGPALAEPRRRVYYLQPCKSCRKQLGIRSNGKFRPRGIAEGVTVAATTTQGSTT